MCHHPLQERAASRLVRDRPRVCVQHAPPGPQHARRARIAERVQAAGGGTLPPDLLNASQLSQGIYAATAAQVLSLQHLQQAAIANTLQDHGLPASDAAAVQSWGRADAEAELWALFVQTIRTSAASRTGDQQNAVAWLTAVQQRHMVQAARNAGLEYVKWAGLDQDQEAAHVLLAVGVGAGRADALARKPARQEVGHSHLLARNRRFGGEHGSERRCLAFCLLWGRP